MSALLWGFLGGVVAWFVTNFISQPLIKIISLRESAAVALARYENYDHHGHEEEDTPEADTIKARNVAFSEVGSQLKAFVISNQIIMKAIHKTTWRPGPAGENLITLSQMPPYGSENWEIRQNIMKHLKLGKKISKDLRI
ncbi:hypothetical protein [Nitrospirillum iridis]|uniref:Uncharacterized protein n=1 Tax=Nitrospirillum iridis TaxID=765888 RepID=A0A7X0EDG7_9PROT|nr:hypothetical protein [Nitrospirillum iridis]MBB6251041.1 hypothetical protein [Nitrospirillum iridis]